MYNIIRAKVIKLQKNPYLTLTLQATMQTKQIVFSNTCIYAFDNN